jgi:hypothetical protein
VECALFGYAFKLPYEVAPYLRICDPLRRTAEVGLVRASTQGTPALGSNTLVLYMHDEWNEAAASALREGLERCRSEMAGLLVIILFRDGLLSAAGADLQSRLKELSAGLPAPLLVNEDVRDGWSELLGIARRARRPSWRLLTPEGSVNWVHDGTLEAESLAAQLERRLVYCEPAGPAHIKPAIGIGARFNIDLVVPPCPPVPLAHPGGSGTKVLFAQKEHAASLEYLSTFAGEQSPRSHDEASVIVVLEGASPDEAEALRSRLNIRWPVFPDPNGQITRRIGVPFWPSVLILDATGTVAGYELGAASRSRDSGEPQQAG